jgi:hypothetical protein
VYYLVSLEKMSTTWSHLFFQVGPSSTHFITPLCKWNQIVQHNAKMGKEQNCLGKEQNIVQHNLSSYHTILLRVKYIFGLYKIVTL